MSFIESIKKMLNNSKSTSTEYIDEYVSEFNLFFKSVMPFSFVVLDKNIIIDVGEAFKDKYKTQKIKRITDLSPNYAFDLPVQKVLIEDKYYTAYTKILIGNDNKEYRFVYFIEINEYNSNADCEIQKICVALITIDNYDEVLENSEDIKQPLLLALIDRKINAMSQHVNGILKKYEKDKYIFIFSESDLNDLRNNNFKILEQIREIDMGNKIPVTLSIGIGKDGTTLSQTMDYANAAIDLALGRGGDQVLIKDSEKYHFFGGVAKDISRNTRVRSRVKTTALSELIENSSDVIIVGHRNADLDCFGSAMGLYKIVDAFDKECKIVLGDMAPNIKRIYNRIVEETEYKNSIFISKKDFDSHLSPSTLIIVTDVHRPSILEVPDLDKKENAKKIVVIDHHRRSTEFIDNAVLVYHETYASSASELVTEMIQYVKRPLELAPVEADALLAGITVDTKNFTVKTGVRTFEAAAYLKRHGADSEKVRMLFQNDLEAFKARSTTVSSAEIFREGIAVSVCPSNIDNPSLIAAQAADELLNISGMRASFVISSHNDKTYISARSIGKINVQVIMEKLGGGGHQTVAGAQFEKQSEDEVLIALKDAINNYLQEV